MTRHTCHLIGAVADFTAYAVGILDGDVEEIAFSGCLIVGDGAFHHVAEIIELMAEHLDAFPAFRTGPLVRVLRVHCAAGIKVTVGFLSRSHDYKHAVDVFVEFLVGIRLHQVACAFNRFVDVGIVKRKSAHFNSVARMGGFYEIIVSAGFLTFAECQGNRYVATCLQPLSPEIVGNFNRRKRNLSDRIAVVGLCFRRFGRCR